MSGDADMNPMSDHARAVRLVLIGAWCLVPVPALVAFFVGNAALPILATSVCFGLMGLIGSRLSGRAARLAVSLALIGQAIVFSAAFAGHAWQADSHMAFFALLATLMVLADPVVVLIAAGVIAAHHLSLGLFLPQLVYPSADLIVNLQRTVMHGLIVAIEAGILFWAIRKQNMSEETAKAARLSAEAASAASSAAHAEAEAARLKTEEALRDARVAQAEAEASKETALAEAERAQSADRRAREQELQDRAERDARKKVQDDVVQALRSGLSALAQGELTKPLNDPFDHAYEDLRHDFNASLTALNGALAHVRDTAGQIGEETTGIASLADGLATRSETQAASLAQVSVTADGMVAQVKKTAADASVAREIAVQTRARADESAKLVVEAVDVMQRIADSSSQVQNIITVIDEIAFQTNLLALNAGVEAARAGDAGRGFAVVASEVRALAQRSSDAAKEIRGLIETSGRQVAEGVDVVDGTGKALGDVSASVTDIAEQISSIARIAHLQAAAPAEIYTALSEFVTANHADREALTEASSASQILKGRTDALTRALDAFEINVEVGAAREVRPDTQKKVA